MRDEVRLSQGLAVLELNVMAAGAKKNSQMFIITASLFPSVHVNESGFKLVGPYLDICFPSWISTLCIAEALQSDPHTDWVV